jgi:hypothetical protein
MMRSGFWITGMPAVLLAACVGDTALPTPTTAAPETTATIPTSDCPPADGVGSASPAVSIYSLTFTVDGEEQVIRDGRILQAVAGDEVLVTEAEICVQPGDRGGGQVCVDVAPLDGDGEEIRTQAGGSHMQPAPSGFATVPGPSTVWTLGEDWQGFVVVLNHWVTGSSDLDCAEGKCERDDHLVIPLP